MALEGHNDCRIKRNFLKIKITEKIFIFSIFIIFLPDNMIAAYYQWTGSSSQDWRTGKNWKPGVAPLTSKDTAVFGTSPITKIEITGDDDHNVVEINGLTFDKKALPYHFTIPTFKGLTLTGIGTENRSKHPQTFDLLERADLQVINDAVAKRIAINTFGGRIQFKNNASAEDSIITNNIGAYGGQGAVVFFDNTTAGNLYIRNNQGITQFQDDSTAGESTIENITDTDSRIDLNSRGSLNKVTIKNANGTVNVMVKTEIGSLTGDIGGKIVLTERLTTGVLGKPDVIASTISGDGRLTKEGSDVLVLSALNTHTGGTSIKEGTLEIVEDGNLGDRSGDLSFEGGTLRALGNIQSDRTVHFRSGRGVVDTNGYNLIFQGLLEGPGLFVKTGDGDLTLEGDSHHTGGIVFERGTLSVAHDSKLGEAEGDLTFEGGTLRALDSFKSDRTIHVTAAGGIIDTNGHDLMFKTTVMSGQLMKIGVGNLILEESTNIDRKGRGLTAGAATGGAIIAGGTLTGTTNILKGNILNNGHLIFRQDKSGPFTGLIEGNGSVEKQGKGNVIFTGFHTYTGLTTITEGSLTNNGSLQSSVAVEQAGRYQGIGSARTLRNAGIVSPGNNGVGTLIVNGNYTQTATGTLQAILGADGASNKLQIKGGAAALGGTLHVTSAGGSFAVKENTYTILTADGGVNGNFANVMTSPGLRYSLHILPGAVLINTERSRIPPEEGNPGIIGQYLNDIVDSNTVSPDLNVVLEALGVAFGNGNADLVAALDQISPDLYRELSFFSFEHTNLARETVGNQQQRILNGLSFEALASQEVSSARLSSFQQLVNDRKIRGGIVPPPSFMFQEGAIPQSGAAQVEALSMTEGALPLNKTVTNGTASVWIESYGQLQSKKTSARAVGNKSKTFGTTLGGDMLILPNTYVGILGGIMDSHFDWKQGRGRGNVQSYYSGLYGLWMEDSGIYVDGQVIGGLDHYDSHRNINFGSIQRTAQEHHKGFSISSDLETGYMLKLGQTTFQPFLNFAHIVIHENTLWENGAGSLNVYRKGNTSQFLRGEIGPLISHFFWCEDTLIYPTVKLSWVQKRPLHKSDQKVNFSFTDQTFGTTVNGDSRVINQFSPGISLTAQFKNGLYLTGDISSEVGSGEQSGQAMLTIGINF